MQFEATVEALEKFILASGFTTESLNPADAVRVMLDFYRQIQFDQLPLEREGGDMLLYQWGTYDWGHGRFFEYSITRQFVIPESDVDEGITQLAIICYFQPSPSLDSLKSGNMWCTAPRNLPQLEAYIFASTAFQAIGTMTPYKVAVDLNRV